MAPAPPHPYVCSLIIIALSIILPIEVLTIECLCNVCEGDDTSCIIPDNRESMCFMSVVRNREDDGTFKDAQSYGCFSSNGDTLNFMQCRANTLRHHSPTYIKCCNDRDFCNENITEPTKEDDPRWAEEPVIYDYRVRVLAISGFAIIFIFTIVVLIKLAHMIVTSREITKEQAASAESSLTDIAFFKSAAELKFPPPVCSYSSTQSYLTSEGSYPKQMSNDESISIGSGIGNKILNERTVANALSGGVLDHVGEGRFGRVVVGQYHYEDVAIKCFRRIDVDAFSREEQIFKWLNHDNIVRLLKTQQVKDEWWMFLEYCPHGSLCDYLDGNTINDPEQAARILYSIINGLTYLHENFAEGDLRFKPAIAHRDLKSKNILMKTNDTCCLADFGHSLFVAEENRLSFGKYGPPRSPLHVGTVRYMAPEILQWNEKLDYYDFYTYAQADLYQFGLVAWEICNRTNVTRNVLDPLTREERTIVLQSAEQHLLPYNNVVPHDPAIADMVKIVCEDNYRPHRREIWEVNPTMKALSALMPECWRPNPISRMETLGIKKRLKDLFMSLQPPEGPQNRCQRTDHTKSAGSKSDFTC